MSHINLAKEILSACLYISKDDIPDDGTLSDLGMLDSLTFQLIVNEIEEKTQREVNPIQLLNVQTVKDLAELLKPEA